MDPRSPILPRASAAVRRIPGRSSWSNSRKSETVRSFDGDGFMGCYEELCAQIARLGIGDAVEFTGYITDQRLRELYSGAAVFAMPSLDEGFGLPALEAMACGAPVVVSAGHALEEVVADAGIVCAPNDVPAWTAALLAPDSRMRAKSLARAAEFSWEHSAACLLRAFETL